MSLGWLMPNFTWQTNRTPSTRRERLEMDLSLALDTLAWCRRCRMRRAAERLMGCVRRIREVLK